MSKALKWSILSTLGTLVLALIFAQQHVAWLGLILALVAGWFARKSWVIYREFGWIQEPTPWRVTSKGNKLS